MRQSEEQDDIPALVRTKSGRGLKRADADEQVLDLDIIRSISITSELEDDDDDDNMVRTASKAKAKQVKQNMMP